MGYYILIALTVLFNVFMLVNTQDYNAHQRHLYEIKFMAGEMAAAAAQYYDFEDYSEGKKMFAKDEMGRPSEGVKAAHFVLENQLRIDMETQEGEWVNDDVYEGTVLPTANSYIKDRVNYRIEFFDNLEEPFLYQYNYEGRKLFTQAIAHPTVVVTLNTGQPRYRGLRVDFESQRVGFHEWRGRID